MDINKTTNHNEHSVAYTTNQQVICDGSRYTGHPRVYLDVSKTGSVVCPYCGQKFIHTLSNDVR